MNSTELLELWRLEIADAEAPYLWSDAEVYSFIDDAQKMWCRKTDGISDATTVDVTRIAAVLNDQWVALHPSILKVRTARRADNGRPVEVLNEEDMAERGWYYDGLAGPLRALVIGAEAHKARLYPKASEAVDIDLTVFRLPLVRITDDGDQTLEIDEEHHRHLMLWMKHLAYSKQDAETFDKTKAAEFEERFLAYCETVKAEERRKRHKTRIVRYGGI